MRLRSAEVKNFLSVGDVEIAYENQGLVLVEGRNLDSETAESNGAGKSSTMSEPILWALFGITSRGVSGDDVIHSEAGKGTSVRLDFERGGHNYAVTRYRKHKEGKNGVVLMKDGVDVSRATTKETDLLIEQAIGIPQRVFLYTVLLGQGTARRFSQLTDASRKEIIEGVTGIRVFDTARKLAKQEVDSNAAAVDRFKLDVERTEAEILRLDSIRSKQQEERKRVWEGDLAKAKRNREVAEVLRASLREKVAKEEGKVEAAQARATEQREVCEEVRKHKAPLDEAVVLLEREQSQQEETSTAELRDALRPLRDTRNKLDVERKKLDPELLKTMRLGLDPLEEAIESCQQAKAAATNERSEFSARLRVYRTGLESVLASSSCPTCRRPITGAGRAEIEGEFQRLIDEVNYGISSCDNKIAKSEARTVEAKKAHAAEADRLHQEYQRQVSEIEEQKNAADIAVEKRREELAAVATARRADLTTRLVEARSVARRATLDLAGAEEEHRSLRETLHKATEDSTRMQSQVAMAERDVLRYTTEVADLENKPPAVDPSIEASIREAEKRLTEMSAQAESTRYDRGVAQAARQVFDRMRSLAISDSLDYLNSRIAKYARSLTDGTVSAKLSSVSESRSGEVLDKIGLEVTTAGGAYQSASGGEQDRIDFAISLALHDLVCSISGSTHNVLVIDEPANFVDPIGLRAIVDLLETKLEGGLETILLASQNPALKEMISQSWVVEKRDGYSSLLTG